MSFFSATEREVVLLSQFGFLVAIQILSAVLATLLKKFCPVIHLNPLDPEEASQPDSPSVRVVG
jgi:hypothetical protein